MGIHRSTISACRSAIATLLAIAFYPGLCSAQSVDDSIAKCKSAHIATPWKVLDCIKDRWNASISAEREAAKRREELATAEIKRQQELLATTETKRQEDVDTADKQRIEQLRNAEETCKKSLVTSGTSCDARIDDAVQKSNFQCRTSMDIATVERRKNCDSVPRDKAITKFRNLFATPYANILPYNGVISKGWHNAAAGLAMFYTVPLRDILIINFNEIGAIEVTPLPDADALLEIICRPSTTECAMRFRTDIPSEPLQALSVRMPLTSANAIADALRRVMDLY